MRSIMREIVVVCCCAEVRALCLRESRESKARDKRENGRRQEICQLFNILNTHPQIHIHRHMWNPHCGCGVECRMRE